MAKFISLKCNSLCFLLFTLRISVVLATGEDSKEHPIKHDLNSYNNDSITFMPSLSTPSTLQISTHPPETIIDVKNDTVQTSKVQKDKTVSKSDSHLYYNSEVFNDQKVFQTYWVDMSNSLDVKTLQVLSQSLRREATITLSFDFPFYGSLIRNVTIAAGGFLYTGNYINSWLAATQYIAPLMANFDMSLSNESFVKFLDNGTAFTVEWEKVALHERPNDGNFTFQATLVDNGDIYFAYKNVSIKLKDIINDDHRPVKVGLSDGYIIDHILYYIRRRTMYEYHRVNLKKEDIRNSTVIHLIALPTCLDYKDCNSCMTSKLDGFNCTWCPAARHCSSNGIDRNRYTWLQKGCDNKNVTTGDACAQPKETFDAPSTSYVHDSKAKEDSVGFRISSQHSA